MTFRLVLTKDGGPYGPVNPVPFVCGWCGERFRDARVLVAHVREERGQSLSPQCIYDTHVGTELRTCAGCGCKCHDRVIR